MTAGGDEQRLQVGAAKRAVGHFVVWYRHDLQESSERCEEVNAAAEFFGGLEGRVGHVQAGGDVQPPALVHLEAIGAARVLPVEDQFAVARLDRAVGPKLEAPQFARAANGVVIVVRDVEVFISWPNQKAVGTLHFAGDDPRDLARRIDAIDAFDEPPAGVAHFHVIARTVARVAEVNAPARVNGQIIWRIEAAAMIGRCQYGDAAVALRAGHATAPRFARHQPALLIEDESIRATGIFAEDAE